LLPLSFEENLLTSDPLDLGGVDAAVKAILGRDDPVEEAVVFVPLPLTLSGFLVGRGREHPQILPAERVISILGVAWNHFRYGGMGRHRGK
jgi:hypothetical protein